MNKIIFKFWVLGQPALQTVEVRFVVISDSLSSCYSAVEDWIDQHFRGEPIERVSSHEFGWNEIDKEWSLIKIHE